jgi:phosphate transport system protein
MINPGTGHTLKKFDEELSTLRDLVLRMGGQVEAQLQRALDALQQCDRDASKDVVRDDRQIDRLELQADEEIANLLALRSPLGIDLRTVLTLSKSVTDLERIGDEAKKIARTCRRFPDDCADMGRLEYMPALFALGQRATRQLHGALDALARLDLERAAEIKAADSALDDECDALMARITAHMAQHPETVPMAVAVLFAAKALERVGDHAKNLTQYVVYLVEGRDVRHPKVNPGL